MNGLRCSILVEMLYSDQLHRNLRKIVCFFRSGFKLCSFAKRCGWIQTNKKSLRGFWLTVCCLKNRKNVKWVQKVNGIPPRRGSRQFLMQSFKILCFLLAGNTRYFWGDKGGAFVVIKGAYFERIKGQFSAQIWVLGPRWRLSEAGLEIWDSLDS